MRSRLDIAVPLLEKYDLQDTFYIIAGGEDEGRKAFAYFRPAFESDHEIGNHSVHHWCCSAGFMDADRQGLEYRTLDEIETELREADRRFKSAFPEAGERFLFWTWRLVMEAVVANVLGKWRVSILCEIVCHGVNRCT